MRYLPIIFVALLLAGSMVAGTPAEDIAEYTAQAREVDWKFAPRSITIYTNLADAYLRQYQQDKNEKALLQAQKVALIAARYSPETAPPRVVLARALELDSQNDKAADQARIALVLEPDNAAAKEVLGRLGAPADFQPDTAAAVAMPGAAPRAAGGGPPSAKTVVGIVILVVMAVVGIAILGVLIGLFFLIKRLFRKKPAPAKE